MKKYISMISFVVIMGLLSVGILIGADFLTRDLIAQNAEFTWKSAILTHHEVAHNSTNFAQLFDDSFEVQTADTSDGQKLTIYVNKTTARSSFQFSGNGLWDVITGVMTLEPDFNTIAAITVTKQGETPGLGGIVAEKQYLTKYNGKHFDDTLGLVIVRGVAQTDYEVEAITGATGTSNMFGGLLNVNYNKFNELFGTADQLAGVKKTILTQNNIQYTDENYNTVFESSFTVLTQNNLVVYQNKSNQQSSYRFTTQGFKGEITGVITLASDFKTIVKVNVLSQSEGWGAPIQTAPEVLATFEGKVFETSGLANNPIAGFDVDSFAGATTTQSKFFAGLNDQYVLYSAAFKGGN